MSVVVSLLSLATSIKGACVIISNARSLLRRPLFWVVIAIWLSVLIGLWTTWPFEPRFTIQADVQILGITRDSQKLLALTSRAVARDETNLVFEVEPSGPLQVWDLKTGSHRSICLPDQACTGKLVKCQDGISRMLEPDGSIIWSDELFRGHFLLLEQGNLRSTDQKTRHLAFDDRTETFRMIRQFEDLSHFLNEGELSPQGRWYVVQTSTDQVEFWQTETGQKYFELNTSGSIEAIAMSPDDQYFVCAVNDANARKTIAWELETKKVVMEVEGLLHAVTFSQDGHRLAGYRTGIDANDEVVVYNFPSGRPLKRWKTAYNSGKQALAFVGDDKYLLCYSQDLSNSGGSYDATIEMSRIWDLSHDAPQFFGERYSNISLRADDPQKIPRFGTTNTGVHEILTGQQVLSISQDDVPILLSQDCKTLVLTRLNISEIPGRMEELGIPFAAYLEIFFPYTEQWVFIDVPSGKTVARLPVQSYSYWLSPDQKTLVTSIDDTQPGIPKYNVWDFPPQRSVLKPAAWSLTIPLLAGVVALVTRLIRNPKRQRGSLPPSPPSGESAG